MQRIKKQRYFNCRGEKIQFIIVVLWFGEMSKHMYSTANLSDVELKDQGNRLFSSRKFDDAISCYSKAIVSDLLNMLILCFHFFFAEPSKTLSILNAMWVISRTDRTIGRKVHNICNHNYCNWIKLFSLLSRRVFIFYLTSIVYAKITAISYALWTITDFLIIRIYVCNSKCNIAIIDFCIHRLRIQRMLHILQIERYAI